MDSNAIAVLQDLKLCTTWRPCPSACSSQSCLKVLFWRQPGLLLASVHWVVGFSHPPPEACCVTPPHSPLSWLSLRNALPPIPPLLLWQNAGKNQATVRVPTAARHSRPFVGLQSSWHDCVAVQQPILSSLIIAYPAYKHDICSRIVSLARTHINKPFHQLQTLQQTPCAIRSRT